MYGRIFLLKLSLFLKKEFQLCISQNKTCLDFCKNIAATDECRRRGVSGNVESKGKILKFSKYSLSSAVVRNGKSVMMR